MVDLQKGSERKGKRDRRGYGKTETNTCAGYGLIQRYLSSSNPEISTAGTSATTIDTGETIVTSKITNDEQQAKPKTVGLSALRSMYLALLVTTAGGEGKFKRLYFVGKWRRFGEGG